MARACVVRGVRAFRGVVRCRCAFLRPLLLFGLPSCAVERAGRGAPRGSRDSLPRQRKRLPPLSSGARASAQRRSLTSKRSRPVQRAARRRAPERRRDPPLQCRARTLLHGPFPCAHPAPLSGARELPLGEAGAVALARAGAGAQQRPVCGAGARQTNPARLILLILLRQRAQRAAALAHVVVCARRHPPSVEAPHALCAVSRSSGGLRHVCVLFRDSSAARDRE